MVRRLLPRFDLPQGHRRVSGRCRQHAPETVVRHEMGAAAGRQISSPRQQLHRPEIDLLVSPCGGVHRIPRLGESRGIQNDVIVAAAVFRRQSVQQIEYVLAEEFHPILQTVPFRVGPRHLHGRAGDVHAGHFFSPRRGGVQTEGAGMAEAVQYPSAGCDAGSGGPVVFLIQEKARLLSFRDVHQINDPVFSDLRDRRLRHGPARQGIPALEARQAFLFPQRKFVPFVEPCHSLSHLFQNVGDGLIDHGPDPVHAEAGDLRGKNASVAVHRQPGHLIRLSVDEPAAGKILARHHGPPVVQGVGHPSSPERGVEDVVGVAGDQPNRDA